MLDVSGASAVNTRVHTQLPLAHRSCGCIGHPAFPATSFQRAMRFQAKLGRDALRERDVVCQRWPACDAMRASMVAHKEQADA